MSLINMSSVNFDSKMFLNQIQNNTIDNTNKNLNESDKVNFTDVLNNAVNKVNDSQVKANNDIEALIKGDAWGYVIYSRSSNFYAAHVRNEK